MTTHHSILEVYKETPEIRVARVRLADGREALQKEFQKGLDPEFQRVANLPAGAERKR